MRAAVVTASDKASAGLREDSSGPLLVELLTELGAEVAPAYVVPDEQAQMEALLSSLADGGEVDLVLTTGGTGGNLFHLGAMLNEYYTFRGWSEEGIPTRATLIRLGLEECL